MKLHKEYFFLFVLVSFDQITKTLTSNLSYELLPFFSIESTRNTGSSFGIFSTLSYYNQFISVLSILIIVYLIFKREEFLKSPYKKLFLLFALAGISGNLIDRIVLFSVRDFLSIPFLFTFNFADFYLTLAGLFLILDNISENKNIKRKIVEKKKK